MLFKQEGDLVLDFCAGAGGKSLAIADRMGVKSLAEWTDISL